jgi:Kef-type K+ transport system membrane component KefB
MHILLLEYYTNNFRFAIIEKNESRGEMQTLFYLGVIFVLGAVMQWASPKLRIPKVVGYLLLGLVIGPEASGIIPKSFVEHSHFAIDMALSLIAVLVGATVKITELKRLGRQILTITLFQGVGGFVTVALGFYLMGTLLGLPAEHSAVIALLFGGLASATAPAATIAITHELKARGSFTSTLLAVVALDDALALILFSFAVMLGSLFMQGSEISLFSLLETMGMIGLSVVVGVVGAVISTLVDKLFSHHKGMETISTLGMVFIVYSLSIYWTLEPLLAALVMGIVMSNIANDFDLVEEEIDNHLEEIIFMLFFILSAMHLDLGTLTALPLAIVAYVLYRFVGKVGGVWIGAKLSGANQNIRRYLGLGLVPQAGVAIGLALSLQDEIGFEMISVLILDVVIATTVIHELLGPLLTKYALKKSGESQL